jgi:hypothetical protein
MTGWTTKISIVHCLERHEHVQQQGVMLLRRDGEAIRHYPHSAPVATLAHSFTI